MVHPESASRWVETLLGFTPPDEQQRHQWLFCLTHLARRSGIRALDLEETLIALSISATLNPLAEAVIGHLKDLNGCELHLSHIPSPGDAAGLRKLGLNATSEPEFATKYLFVS